MRYGEARGLESRDVQTGDGASGTYTVGWILAKVVYDLVLEYANGAVLTSRPRGSPPFAHVITARPRAPRRDARGRRNDGLQR